MLYTELFLWNSYIEAPTLNVTVLEMGDFRVSLGLDEAITAYGEISVQ